jgi:Fe-S-cluster-containing dehydrogenase component
MKRLFIDLEKCASCKECAVCCDYFYHPQNNGIASIREYATFATICRHCEEAPCVNSCYHNALERASDGSPRGPSRRGFAEAGPSRRGFAEAGPSRQGFAEAGEAAGHIKRYKMRCTSCKSCSVACPFGIIFQEFIPYLDSRCDFCVGASDRLPGCVSTCPEKAIEIKEAQESPEQNIYLVGENLAVHTLKWSREDIQPPKKK